jgi:CheY-like chemotaxis protein
MTAKRALIVDDSRSARVILSRMLEGYGLEVDSAESAEQALEYLRQTRPDVIFMDHLMPGMDGFQAIQAIKSNPETAMIPVMMYTSQEGELYVGQARALGAVGVLPKTVKQVEVSRVLYQLRLLPDRREGRSQLFNSQGVVVETTSAGAGTPPPLPAPDLEAALRNAFTPALKNHSSELRRFVLAALEAFARRITEAKSAAADTAAKVEPLPVAEPPQPSMSNRWPLLAAIAAIALLPTIVLAVLYTRTLESNRAQMQSTARVTAVIEELQAQLATIQQAVQSQTAAATASAGAEPPKIESEAVPYGEAPLAGARLDRLRELIGDLKAEGFRGKVKVATFIGEFCLTGNGIEGYSVATAELPAKRCDLFGNPFEDSLTAAQRQSLAFANLVATIRQETADMLTVEVTYGGRRPSVPYPPRETSDRLTAGEWNRIAMLNNRVEFSMEPTT